MFTYILISSYLTGNVPASPSSSHMEAHPVPWKTKSLETSSMPPQTTAPTTAPEPPQSAPPCKSANASRPPTVEEEPCFNPADFDWLKKARPNQLPPEGAWRTWLILAGRGFGKTRTGSETLRWWVDQGLCRRIALVAQTLDEARQVMVEGVSGLLSVYPPKDANSPKYQPSKRLLTWPNGALATLYGADHYEHLRGPQFDMAWVDEFAKFRHPQACYDQLMMSLRLGTHPRCIITTTPRPLPLLKELDKEETTVTTRGTTFENAQNLAPSFLTYVQKRYGKGALGRQELYAEWIENDGTLWKRENFIYKEPSEDLMRILVAVDPAVTGSGDETGIVIVGKASCGAAFVLEDASGLFHPHDWAQRVIQKYHQYRADGIVAEVNQGGDLVGHMIRSFDPAVPFTAVHATRGKARRAEPISALYAQGHVFHKEPFPELEDQMCNFVPDAPLSHSPDRMDALVWGLTELFKKQLVSPVQWWWSQ